MGCGASKVGVAPGGGTPKKIVVSAKDEDTATVVTRLDSGVGRDRGPSAKSGGRKAKRQNSWLGSSAVEVDTVSDRGGSATSKVSKHSTDSGFDDKAYQHFITEDSRSDLVNQVENEFTPVEDLGVYSSYHLLPRNVL